MGGMSEQAHDDPPDLFGLVERHCPFCLTLVRLHPSDLNNRYWHCDPRPIRSYKADKVSSGMSDDGMPDALT